MADVETLIVTAPLLETKCTLGEGKSHKFPMSSVFVFNAIFPGPLYDPATRILHFLDIGQSKVFHYDTVSTKLTFDQFDEPVTALALRSNGQGVSAPVILSCLCSLALVLCNLPKAPMNL